MKFSKISRTAVVLTLLSLLFWLMCHENGIYLRIGGVLTLVFRIGLIVACFLPKVRWLFPLCALLFPISEVLVYRIEHIFPLARAVVAIAFGVWGLIAVIRGKKRAVRIGALTAASVPIILYTVYCMIDRISGTLPLTVGVIVGTILVNSPAILRAVAVIVWAAHRTPTEKLAQLKKRFEKGKLTEEKYAAQKEKILKSL